MLIRFVYLDKPTLAGYSAQLDGGLIAETKVRLVKKGTGGGHVDVKVFGFKGDRTGENEHIWTMSYPAEAQFQRLLAAAYDTPDDIAWIDVVNPDANFQDAQVGEIIAWECDVDIATPSRIAAKGGGGDQLLGIMTTMAAVGATGVNMGGTQVGPEQAELFKTQAALARQMLDGMNVNRIAVGRDPETTNWSIFGPLYADHLRVEDIDRERLIVVGKIRRIINLGETRKLVNTEAMQVMQFFAGRGGQKSGNNQQDNEIAGPALELDILAIYR